MEVHKRYTGTQKRVGLTLLEGDKSGKASQKKRHLWYVLQNTHGMFTAGNEDQRVILVIIPCRWHEEVAQNIGKLITYGWNTG